MNRSDPTARRGRHHRAHHDSPPKAVVINLERSVDRRQAMLERLRGHDLDVEFLEAVDARALDRADYPASGRLRGGELGCYLSHVSAWRRLADSDLDSMLVLEDDVELEADLAAVCRALAHLPFTPDIVRLSSLKDAAGPSLSIMPAGRRLLVPDCHPSGTQGYWISRAGARRLLRVWATPRRAIDKMFDRYWAAGVCALLLDPAVVRAIPDHASEIEARPQGADRPPYLLRKLERWRRRRAVSRWYATLQRACGAHAAAPDGGPR